MCREARRPTWTVEDKTLLVVGLGGIGTEVARRAHGLGMLDLNMHDLGVDFFTAPKPHQEKALSFLVTLPAVGIFFRPGLALFLVLSTLWQGP